MLNESLVSILPKDPAARALANQHLMEMQQGLSKLAKLVEQGARERGRPLQQAWYVVGATLLFVDFMDHFVEQHLPIYPEMLSDAMAYWLENAHGYSFKPEAGEHIGAPGSPLQVQNPWMQGVKGNQG